MLRQYDKGGRIVEIRTVAEAQERKLQLQTNIINIEHQLEALEYDGLRPEGQALDRWQLAASRALSIMRKQLLEVCHYIRTEQNRIRLRGADDGEITRADILSQAFQALRALDKYDVPPELLDITAPIQKRIIAYLETHGTEPQISEQIPNI